jgi:protein-L-isoaspartate(D-aspartate) O-methyltransferase
MLSQLHKWFQPGEPKNAGEFAAARQSMVEHDLAGRGIRSQAVLAAMSRVPREVFVPAELQGEAYADRALAIACDQSISQPFIVALMTEALDIRTGNRVLEIGTGSGYQTSILAELADAIVTVERHEELSTSAQQVLKQWGYSNIEFVVADGTLGWPPRAPYDRILVTAAAQECPPALLQQLVDGGVLVAPIGTTSQQVLRRFQRRGDDFSCCDLSPCRFVPLVGQQGVSMNDGR